MRRHDESGLTIIELLVTFSILAIVSTAMYSVVFSGTRSSNVARDVARQSQEARLAFNRMVRDTREARSIVAASPTSFRVEVDFDGSGTITAAPDPNANGDYEDVTFAFNEADGSITLNGAVLMRGVSKVGTNDVFTYSSNKLEYDTNADGVVTMTELAAAQAGGSNLVSPLERYLTNVVFSFMVTSGDRVTEFYSQAELRNLR